MLVVFTAAEERSMYILAALAVVFFLLLVWSWDLLLADNARAKTAVLLFFVSSLVCASAFWWFASHGHWYLTRTDISRLWIAYVVWITLVIAYKKLWGKTVEDEADLMMVTLIQPVVLGILSLIKFLWNRLNGVGTADGGSTT